MKNTTVSLAIVVMVAVVAFWLGGQTAVSQEQMPPVAKTSAPVERFAIIVAGSQRNDVILIDSATGDTWQRSIYGSKQWGERIASPARGETPRSEK